MVPSLLILGVMPTFRVINKYLPTQMERILAIKMAREGVVNICAKQRNDKVIRSNLPRSVRYNLKSGAKVYAYSEKRKKWISELVIINVKGKNVWANDGTRTVKLSISRVTLQYNKQEESNDVRRIIKSLSQFSMGGPTGILITEVLSRMTQGAGQIYLHLPRKRR